MALNSQLQQCLFWNFNLSPPPLYLSLTGRKLGNIVLKYVPEAVAFFSLATLAPLSRFLGDFCCFRGVVNAKRQERRFFNETLSCQGFGEVGWEKVL